MQHDELIRQIDEAYRSLTTAREDLASADRALSEHVRAVRIKIADTLLEAKNERTANLYLEGALDNEDHRRLLADKERADLNHQHARREVERLHLVVKVLSAPIPTWASS
jgi:hypothetical protein